MRLQNPDLIGVLFDRYYQQGVRSADMSSHWHEFSTEFKVQMDADGQLACLTGFGFGELRWNGTARRAVQDLCIASHLVHLPQRRELLRLGPMFLRVCRAMGVDPTLDAFRQLCTLEFLDRWVAKELPHRPLRFLMIGDGFGLLAAMVKARWPDANVVMVDLGQTLLFQAFHLQQSHAAPVTHALAGDNEAANADFVYCPSDRREAIASMNFDVAVNVASMQEMDPSTVASYFDFFRQRLKTANLFYCCNRSWKRLPDGQVSALSQYPWVSADRVLVDEPCAWHQYYFTLRSTGRAPRLLGMPVPGVSHYDGTHRHRVVAMSTTRIP